MDFERNRDNSPTRLDKSNQASFPLPALYATPGTSESDRSLTQQLKCSCRQQQRIQTRPPGAETSGSMGPTDFLEKGGLASQSCVWRISTEDPSAESHTSSAWGTESRQSNPPPCLRDLRFPANDDRPIELGIDKN